MSTEKPNLLTYASKIRKEGEAWKDAVNRSKFELYGDESKPVPKKTEQKNSSIRQPGETAHDFFKRKRTK